MKVMCPSCGKKMQYMPLRITRKSRKQCVYCGRSFLAIQQACHEL